MTCGYREAKASTTKKHRKDTKLFRSGELAEILGVTIMSVSNFRKEGMPYEKETSTGYLYSFLAIKWFIMFKTQSIHENKHYRRSRELINIYETLNQNYLLEINHSLTIAERRAYLIKEYNENIKKIKKVFLSL